MAAQTAPAKRNKAIERDPTALAIKPGATYEMRISGIVLMAMERSLFIRADGVFLRAKAHVRPGEATLDFRQVDPSSWRSRLARRILGL